MEFVDTSIITKWLSNKFGICEECKIEAREKEELAQLAQSKLSSNSTNLNDTDYRLLTGDETGN